MKIITKSATAYNAQGYITNDNFEICDHGDAVSINGTPHDKSDIVIDGNRITSKLAGWKVEW